MKEKLCVFDIDDTSFEFSTPLIDLHNKLFGTRISPSQLTKWDFENLIIHDHNGGVIHGADIRRTMVEYIDDGFLASLEPKPFTIEAIDICIKLGYKVAFLTARTLEQKKQTIISLLKYNINHDFIIFQKDKKFALEQLSESYDIEFFVDDNVKYLLESIKLPFVKRSYIINCPHNYDNGLDQRIIRVNNLMEVVSTLKAAK